VAFTGSQGGGQLSPVRLTLAGVALAAVLEGLSSGISLLNADVYDQLRFWQAGSLDIRTLQTVKIVLLPVLLAAGIALISSRALNSLNLAAIPRPRSAAKWRARSFLVCWPSPYFAVARPQWSAPSPLSG
jgi:ABC-type enterobactin transport system permease subunit